MSIAMGKEQEWDTEFLLNLWSLTLVAQRLGRSREEVEVSAKGMGKLYQHCEDSEELANIHGSGLSITRR